MKHQFRIGSGVEHSALTVQHTEAGHRPTGAGSSALHPVVLPGHYPGDRSEHKFKARLLFHHLNMTLGKFLASEPAF